MASTNNAVTTEMKRRVATGRDPISGEPWKTCAPHTVAMADGGAVCEGCGQRVTLDDKGAWEHVR